MALKAVEQVKFDSLNQTAGILHAVGQGQESILTHLRAQIDDLESSTNSKLTLSYVDEKPLFTIIDLKSDFVRTRLNTDKSMLSLRAKIFGIPLDIKVRKDADSLRATNEQVAESLAELAKIVAGMPMEMVDAGQADWPRQVGSAPKLLDAELSGDDDDAAADVGGQVNVAAGAATVSAPATQAVAVASQDDDTDELPAGMVNGQAQSNAPAMGAPAALSASALPGEGPIDDDLASVLLEEPKPHSLV